MLVFEVWKYDFGSQTSLDKVKFDYVFIIKLVLTNWFWKLFEIYLYDKYTI